MAAPAPNNDVIDEQGDLQVFKDRLKSEPKLLPRWATDEVLNALPKGTFQEVDKEWETIFQLFLAKVHLYIQQLAGLRSHEVRRAMKTVRTFLVSFVHICAS